MAKAPKAPEPIVLPDFELVPIGDLIPYARNARTHSPEQVRQIAASIREFRFTNPVLRDGENGIIAGHGRILAMELLGYTEVPCIRVDWLTEAQRRAYILADNKLALNAGWDEDLLRIELGDLKSMGFELSLVGFNDDELADLFETTEGGLTDPDDAPALPAPDAVVSEAGDVWILGDHRLRCGDSTVPDEVDDLLGADKPVLMVTDPPYGVEYDPVNARATNVAHGAVENDDRCDWREAYVLFPGDIAYVWHSGLHAGEVMEGLKSSRLLPRAQIVWVKQRPVMSRGAYHWQHEPCVVAEAIDVPAEDEEEVIEHGLAAYAVRKGKTAKWRGGRKQSTVWYIEHVKNDTGHSTQKPVDCMRRPMLNNSKPGDLVYEPFSGSGSTIIAAEMCGRVVRAMELKAAYVDVAVLRWQAFTGKTAVHARTGETFAETAKERGVEVG